MYPNGLMPSDVIYYNGRSETKYNQTAPMLSMTSNMFYRTWHVYHVSKVSYACVISWLKVNTSRLLMILKYSPDENICAESMALMEDRSWSVSQAVEA